MDNSSLKHPLDHTRVIIHIDVDCFYAQVEMVKNPALRNKPLGIKQKNLMVTCNYVARSLGIKKCMWIKDALEIVPNLVVIDGSDLAPYREFSSEIFSLLQTYTGAVEKLGLDENFIDVTDILEADETVVAGVKGHIYGTEKEDNENFEEPCHCGCFSRLIAGSQLAKKMRGHIFEVTGLTTCAGVSVNKLLAKLVSGHCKPNDQTVLFPSQVEGFMKSVKVREIPGIGSATDKILESLGITSIDDLQSCPIEVLSRKFNPDLTLRLKNLSQGTDLSIVRSSGRPQSIGIEDAFRKVTSFDEVKIKMETLLNRLLKLLSKDGRFPTGIRITVRKYRSDGRFNQRETKQWKLPQSMFGTSNRPVVSDKAKALLREVALNYFCKIVDVSQSFHLTLLGVGFVKFFDRAKNQQSISHFLQKICPGTAALIPTKKKIKIESHCGDFGNDYANSDSSSEEDFRLQQTETLSSSHPNKVRGTPYLTSSRSSISETPPGFDPDVWSHLPDDIKQEAASSSQSLERVFATCKNPFHKQVAKKRSFGKSKSKIGMRTPDQKSIQSFFHVVKKPEAGVALPEILGGFSQSCRELREPASDAFVKKKPNADSAKAQSKKSIATTTSCLQLKEFVSQKVSIKQRLISRGISTVVFEELPSDIQEEILANL